MANKLTKAEEKTAARTYIATQLERNRFASSILKQNERLKEQNQQLMETMITIHNARQKGS